VANPNPAHAIQATVAESRGLPGASARERFKELVLNALAAEKQHADKKEVNCNHPAIMF
jgi:hypothetical protein